MTATAAKRLYTVDEYLRTEARSGERYQFYNGNIIPMPGGTLPHNRICRNILSELDLMLKSRSGFEIFGSDQKIYLPEYHFYLYPDAVVVAETPVLAEDVASAIINPLLIIEVLSPSTGNYDREQKFLQYRSLPSFKEYALVRQDAPEVLTFFREKPDTWKENMVKGADQSVHFQSINTDLALQLIYRNVEFSQ
ncbi:MAG: Uma2 family endonuclease [Saprospiraceae bacterium]|nr:Uma2 family endonuclease [Saprospiraceae bacterium]